MAQGFQAFLPTFPSPPPAAFLTCPRESFALVPKTPARSVTCGELRERFAKFANPQTCRRSIGGQGRGRPAASCRPSCARSVRTDDCGPWRRCCARHERPPRLNKPLENGSRGPAGRRRGSSADYKPDRFDSTIMVLSHDATAAIVGPGTRPGSIAVGKTLEQNPRKSDRLPSPSRNPRRGSVAVIPRRWGHWPLTPARVRRGHLGAMAARGHSADLAESAKGRTLIHSVRTLL